jgi:protein-S-isoprenylcysteine O-methyltransferase Ste14
MIDYTRIVLPIYFVLYIFLLVIARAIIVRKKIGKSPIALKKADDANGLIALYLKTSIILLGTYVMLSSLIESTTAFLLPIHVLESGIIKIAGMALLAISLMWTYMAQANMRDSWRIGIDEEQKTALVTDGVFRFSRNPIYLGVITTIAGLFLVTPNAFTLLLAITTWLLIQIQIRLEETFLLNEHGDQYLIYKNQVRRFI